MKALLLLLLCAPLRAQVTGSNGGAGSSGGAPSGAAGGALTGTYPSPQLGVQTQALNMGSNLINGVTDPVAAQDVATKNYVDASTVTKTLPTKAPVYLATTAALPSNVYNNGSSGVGATMIGAGLGAITIDGQVPPAGVRILVNNEATAANNGLYYLNTNGAGLFFKMTRTTDFDTASEMGAGEAVIVTSGTTNTDEFFVLLASVTTVGTDPLNFSPAKASFNGGAVSNVTTFASSTTFNADAQIALSTLTFNATMSINLQTNPNPRLVLTGNITSITLVAPSVPSDANGHKYTMEFCQDSTGSRTGPATWTNTIWPGYGVAPTLTTTASHCDYFFARYEAYDGNYHMMPALNN